MRSTASGRAVVLATLRGRTSPRPPFIPLVHCLAARLAQTSPQDMAYNPTLLANSLGQAQALFGYDAVVVGFDDTIAAEACGCDVVWGETGPAVGSHPWQDGAIPGADVVASRGRVPVVVEVARRLKAVLGEGAAVLGVVPGPWTLAGQLYGPAFGRDWAAGTPASAGCLAFAARVGVAVARLFGEARVDTLLVMEAGRIPVEGEGFHTLQGLYRTLWNVARFYNLPGILAPHEHQPADLSGLAALGATALALARTTGAGPEAWPDARLVPGRALPATALEGPTETVAAAVAEVAAGAPTPAWFLTTEWEILADTPPENLHAAVAAARALQRLESRDRRVETGD